MFICHCCCSSPSNFCPNPNFWSDTNSPTTGHTNLRWCDGPCDPILLQKAPSYEWIIRLRSYILQVVDANRFWYESFSPKLRRVWWLWAPYLWRIVEETGEFGWEFELYRLRVSTSNRVWSYNTRSPHRLLQTQRAIISWGNIVDLATHFVVISDGQKIILVPPMQVRDLLVAVSDQPNLSALMQLPCKAERPAYLVQ